MLQKARFGICYFLLFCLPFLVIPGINFGFESPKVIFAESLIGLLLILTLFRKKERFFHKLNPWFLGSISVLFLSSIYSLYLFGFGANFTGNAFRLQGVLLLWNLILFSLISADFLPGTYARKWLGIALGFLCLAVFILPQTQGNRFVGTLGEPNSLAAVGLFIFCLFFSSFKNRIIEVLSVLVMISIIVLSGSRSAFFAFTILVLLFLTSKIIHRKIVLVAIAVVLYCLVLTLPFLENQYQITDSYNLVKREYHPLSNRFEERWVIWQTAFYTGVESPVIGHGFGNIQKPIRAQAEKMENNLRYTTVDSSHNIFLDLWVEAGGVGVITFVFIIGLSFYHLMRKPDHSYAASLLVILIMASFNPVSIAILLPLWWLFGVANLRHI